jgi:hypothetical protein
MKTVERTLLQIKHLKYGALHSTMPSWVADVQNLLKDSHSVVDCLTRGRGDGKPLSKDRKMDNGGTKKCLIEETRGYRRSKG